MVSPAVTIGAIMPAIIASQNASRVAMNSGGTGGSLDLGAFALGVAITSALVGVVWYLWYLMNKYL